MNPEIGKIDIDALIEELLKVYIDPTELNNPDEEILLKEGLIANIRPIENLGQAVSPHADEVFVGDIGKHADQIFEAEITLPSGKKLLVVWKPDSGANKGSDAIANPNKKPVPLPEDTSPHSHKEAGAWIVAQYLSFEHISTPAVVREINGEKGCLRPYIYGKPVDILSDEQQDQSFSDTDTVQDIALYDFLLQTVDRRDANLIWEKEVNAKRQLKVIDHPLTFLPDYYTRDDFYLKGPRLAVAFNKDTGRVKQTPLPSRHIEILENFTAKQDEIKAKLALLLNEKEIEGLFNRVKKVLSSRIFL